MFEENSHIFAELGWSFLFYIFFWLCFILRFILFK